MHFNFKSVQFYKIVKIFKTCWYPFPEYEKPKAITIKIETAEFLLTCDSLTPADSSAPYSCSVIPPHWEGRENQKGKSDKNHGLR